MVHQLWLHHTPIRSRHSMSGAAFGVACPLPFEPGPGVDRAKGGRDDERPSSRGARSHTPNRRARCRPFNDEGLTRRSFGRLASLGAASTLLIPNPAIAKPIGDQSPTDLTLQALGVWLGHAARRQGMRIDVRHVLVVLQDGFTLVSAPMAGLSRVDPISMSQGGMRTSFFFMDAPDAGVPPDFYSTSIVAQADAALGRIDVIAQFHRGTRLIDRRAGFAIVTSLLAPPDASPVVIEGFSLDPNPAEPAREKYTSCPNGVYFATLCGTRMTRCRRDDPDNLPLTCADDTNAVKEMSDTVPAPRAA